MALKQKEIHDKNEQNDCQRFMSERSVVKRVQEEACESKEYKTEKKLVLSYICIKPSISNINPILSKLLTQIININKI